ncbi:MAG: hypothetical protein VX294_07645 [Candidatus Latescibacterota bacterium]|nr:hypothetical protein [Candidatus Latescibacterota bacterium]
MGTFTLHQRTGLLLQIVKTLRYSFREKCWYNALGLRNPGIHTGIGRYRPNTIISIAAIEAADWELLAKRIPDNIPLELNISCPNIAHFNDYTRDIGCFSSRNPIIKLSPNMALSDVDSLIDQGFSKFHAVNTLKTPKGARSGEILKEYSTKFITHIKNIDENNKVIAGGGITSIEDIKYYKDLGADAFSLGTVCFNLVKLRRILKNTKEEEEIL